MKYAYGQLPLIAETKVQYNFFYSLEASRRVRIGSKQASTANHQLAMDCILSEFPQAHAPIDGILVVTKGTEKDHIGTVEKFLKQLDKKNMSLKLTKSKFVQRESEWLGHRINRTGVTPLVRKTIPIEALKPPRTGVNEKFQDFT